nr:hypothetical protein [Tanacetum cinerariifolium]
VGGGAGLGSREERGGRARRGGRWWQVRGRRRVGRGSGSAEREVEECGRFGGGVMVGRLGRREEGGRVRGGVRGGGGGVEDGWVEGRGHEDGRIRGMGQQGHGVLRTAGGGVRDGDMVGRREDGGRVVGKGGCVVGRLGRGEEGGRVEDGWVSVGGRDV